MESQVLFLNSLSKRNSNPCPPFLQVSVFERSPARLLKEIILVDDNNDDETVGEELKVLDKVGILEEKSFCKIIDYKITAPR